MIRLQDVELGGIYEFETQEEAVVFQDEYFAPQNLVPYTSKCERVVE